MAFGNFGGSCGVVDDLNLGVEAGVGFVASSISVWINYIRLKPRIVDNKFISGKKTRSLWKEHQMSPAEEGKVPYKENTIKVSYQPTHHVIFIHPQRTL